MDERLVAAYDYPVTSRLIAQRPSERRDAARLLAVRQDTYEDHVFSELPELLRPGDVVVVNETQVVPARLTAFRQSGGRVELLLLCPADGAAYDPNARDWRALIRPGRRLRSGERVVFRDAAGADLGSALVGDRSDDGSRVVSLQGDMPARTLMERAGRLPLPPYIHNESDEAQRRYQTVFAAVPGSAAAPTAGLHLTNEVFDELRERHIDVVKLVLHVGWGTFAPMRAERIDAHAMHAERYAISSHAAERIASAKTQGRRIVAVGTTVVRALEGRAAECGSVVAGESTTSLFITPGFRFRVVDALVTNFHWPRSTLLVLVSAFAGRERILDAYRTAMERGYAFFSFGDAMLLERT